MPYLPEWAPSLHPLIIHFPIALLLFALFFDVLFLIFRKHPWLNANANALYLLGALGVVAAFFSGRQAADLANIPPFVHPTLSEHADLGQYTAWFFGIYGLFRLAGWWKSWYENIIVLFVSVVIAVGGAVLLFETAEHGAELVYRYGIGVKASEKEAMEKVVSESGMAMAEDGSWEWRPANGAEIVLKQQFNWLLGEAESLHPQTAHDESAEDVLVLNPQNSRVLFTAGNPLNGVQADVRVNLDEFQGKFMLLHHLQDAQNFDFVALADGEMRLGQMVDGKASIKDRGAVNASGWIQIRAVGHGGHFRGYVNEKLVTHGHARGLPPGPAGFLIEGSGTILIDEIVVHSIQQSFQNGAGS